jgi:hypothetical protein
VPTAIQIVNVMTVMTMKSFNKCLSNQWKTGEKVNDLDVLQLLVVPSSGTAAQGLVREYTVFGHHMFGFHFHLANGLDLGVARNARNMLETC